MSEFVRRNLEEQLRQHAQSLEKGVFARLRDLGYGPLVADVLREEWAVVPVPRDQWASTGVPLALDFGTARAVPWAGWQLKLYTHMRRRQYGRVAPMDQLRT